MKKFSIILTAIVLSQFSSNANAIALDLNMNNLLSKQDDGLKVSAMTKADAIKIGMNYVNFKAKNEDIKWKNAYNFIASDVLDLNGNLQSYELSIYDESQQPLGYVVVPAKNGFGAISIFNYEGLSNFDLLNQKYDKEWKPLLEKNKITVLEKRFVGTEQGFVAVAIKTNQPLINIPGATIVNGYQVFTLYPIQNVESLLTRAVFTNYASSLNNTTYRDEEKDRLKFLKGDLKSQSDFTTFLSPSPSSPVTVDIGSDFSPYNQEIRYWPHGYCNTGCTPVAFGILLEYWDRHGYPALYGWGLGDNKVYNNFQDDHVRYILGAIAQSLGTSCSATNKYGETNPTNGTNIVNFIKTRGYNNWSANNSSYSKADNQAWDYLVNDLKEKRPSVASVAVSGVTASANHSVVAYKYTDYPDNSLDSFCYRTGWGNSPATACMTRQTHFMTTVVRPGFVWNWP